ncbi:MAG: threonylcarbamoyl-AMP synthase [Elusimicrobia bacterium]|nr:threonylcarbamoyl-AMP synthase [Elusimicrobiota bacterium]
MKVSNKSLKTAAKILKKGGVVAFPTETVYGLGACAFDSKAAAKIFKIKKRPFFDPLIVHICDKSQLSILSLEIPPKVKRLTDLFWPGPLTLILKKKESVPDIVTAGLNTVAVRMPSCQISLKLIKEAGFPIAAPSANLFSRISPVRASHVKNQLKNGPDLILDGGKTLKGLESTIIKFEKGKFYILREGALPSDKIEKKAKIKLIKPKQAKITAPGMLKKHYSPKAEVIIVKGEKEAGDLRAAYIAFKKLPLKNFKYKKVLSSKGCLEEAAANLFDFFHETEKMKIKKIYVEKVPHKGLGKAINDRIIRAAAKEG